MINNNLSKFSDRVYPLLGSFWNVVFSDRQLARAMVSIAVDSNKTHTHLNTLLADAVVSAKDTEVIEHMSVLFDPAKVIETEGEVYAEDTKLLYDQQPLVSNYIS